MVVKYFDNSSSDFEVGTSYSTRTDATRAVNKIVKEKQKNGYVHEIIERKFYILDDWGDVSLEKTLRIDK